MHTTGPALATTRTSLAHPDLLTIHDPGTSLSPRPQPLPLHTARPAYLISQARYQPRPTHRTPSTHHWSPTPPTFFTPSNPRPLLQTSVYGQPRPPQSALSAFQRLRPFAIIRPTPNTPGRAHSSSPRATPTISALLLLLLSTSSKSLPSKYSPVPAHCGWRVWIAI